MAVFDTPKGRVEVLGPLTEEQIESLDMNDNLNNFRRASRQKEALLHVAGLPEGIVYVAKHENEIIGYVLFHHPNQYSRWNKHPRLLELGAIEISRDWKRQGVASKLLQEAFRNPKLEEYIVITTEFYWHWDIEGSGLDVWRYQKMLKKLFGSAGFKRRHTDDPEILEHPANMLMVRFGKNITDGHLKAFEDLTYRDSIFS